MIATGNSLSGECRLGQGGTWSSKWDYGQHRIRRARLWNGTALDTATVAAVQPPREVRPHVVRSDGRSRNSQPTPELRWRDTEHLSEARRESRWSLIADREGDVGDRQIRVGQKLPRAADPQDRQPLMRRLAGREAEGRAEMKAAQSHEGRDLVEADILAQMVVDTENSIRGGMRDKIR